MKKDVKEKSTFLKIGLIILFVLIICEILIFINTNRYNFIDDNGKKYYGFSFFDKMCFVNSHENNKPYCAEIIYKNKKTLKLKSSHGVQIYGTSKKDVPYQLIQDSKMLNAQKKKVAVLYISTGNYIRFWEDFYKYMKKHFLLRHDVTYFLITNHMDIKVNDDVIKIYQEQLPWPYITYKRYHFFTAIEDKLKDFDYIFFLNGNLLPQTEIDEEIFPSQEQGLMGSIHPGHYLREKTHYRYERNPKSLAYVPLNQEAPHYLAGGLNGGTSSEFLKMSKELMKWTDVDIKNNVMPAWHDESMFNKYIVNYIKDGKKPLILPPNYLIPQLGYMYLDEYRPIIKFLILDKTLYGGYAYLRGMQLTAPKTKSNLKKSKK